MNLRFSLGVLLLAANVLIATAARAGVAQDVAAYDRMLADVRQGQTTIAMGDMIVPIETVRLWRERLANAGKPIAESASQTGVTKWTGGNVYYAFNANVSAAHRIATLDAMAEWATYANLRFIPRTAEANYVVINDDPGISGGNSAVGMIGGVQQLNIGSTSWNRGTLVHELGHTLGLIHEHQRGDRDTFVTINFSNVPGGAGDLNFILIPTSTNNGAYDFLSVMHYARKALAVNPAIDTITPKPAYTQFIDLMGASYLDRVLSRGDRDGIALMYGAGPAISTLVTNTKDAGVGSLRAAIYKALDIVTDTPSATPAITFQIPNTDPNFSGGVFTIKPSDRLPGPGPRATIDATTQTAFTGNTNAAGPEVVLNGDVQSSETSTYGLGLQLGAANVTVRGLVINGFNTRGILITGTGAMGCTVAGCYIGTNAAGTAASANAFSGIEISGGASSNTIGGTTLAERNVISGNLNQGIFIKGMGTNGNIVAGNFIGTNAAGTTALANSFAGVEISSDAGTNTVGGTLSGAGNVLSGNLNQGVAIIGSNSNVVAGNLIGSNAAGTAAVPNGFAGIQIFGGAQNNVVGGTVTAARNVISGNANQGIAISGPVTSGNAVRGNWIGLNAAGTAALPNSWGGVQIFGGAANNTIGGAPPGAGNVISGNSAQGVVISNGNSSANAITGNRIGTNPAGTVAIPNSYSGIGLFTGASANIITGNQISGNGNQGIYIGDTGTNANVVAGNSIGLDAAGTAALPNAWAGVQIAAQAQDNIIGGTSAGTRNVISGNLSQGVLLNSTGTAGNRVQGNYIGTNAAGTVAVANSFAGVELLGGATNNWIGGAEPGAGNVISGNASRGVTLAQSGTTANTIAGNFIGLNATGAAALPNAGPGIAIFNGAHHNTIGGTAGGRNFIAGNNGSGLTLSGDGTTGNVVAGNSIGVSPSGVAVANTAEGIALFADFTGSAAGNGIGGDTPGAANLISGNAFAGVAIYNDGTINNRISGNSIFLNGGLGIDIWGDGVTANDSGDGDTGPNHLQNFPVLTSAVLGLATTVSGSLNSTANTTFRIEFFASATGDATGNGEGQNFIGSKNVTTDPGGNVSFAEALPVIVPAGQQITATAIDPAGNTSEFAGNVTVTTTDTDGDGLPNVYETANGLLTNFNDAGLDFDGDGMSNLAEFRAGTDPRNASSVFRLGPPGIAGGGIALSLGGMTGRTYRVEFADSLDAPVQWRILADQILGTASPIPLLDPGAAALSRRFYRATVQP